MFHFLLPFLISISTETARQWPATGTISLPVYTVITDSIHTIPFSRAGNLIVVRARVDSVEGNFIVDTGCPGLVLNQTYFRHYRTLESEEVRNDINGSQFTVSQAELQEFSFAGQEYPRVRADLSNLGSIENAKGIRLLGLIGVEFFRNCQVVFDFEKSEIRVRRSSKKRGSSGAGLFSDTEGQYEIPITVTDSRIMVSTELGGKKVRFILDSGAERNLLDSRLPDRVFENVRITGRTLLTGAGTGRVEVLTGDLQSLKLGDHSFVNLPVVIANLERTCFAYDGCVDGVVGFDVLSVKRIGFNFVTNKMYIWK